MIDHLRGELVRKEGDAIVLRVAGIGFRLETPAGAYAGETVGELLEIPTTLLFRQESLALYGFSSPTEREFFGLLTSISGIGPKSALGILGHSTPAQLADAIIREDISALVQVKGIGKKGARRIIVELAEKIRALKPASGSSSAGQSTDMGLFGAAAQAEALEVLISLGCSREEAQAALEAVADRVVLEEEDAADLLVMHALKALGGR
jgi:Holliday junction DNA helicase RuvA